MDGVDIPALYHVGGFRSTINSDLVRAINLSPGAYGADYGRGLGGLVRIDLGRSPTRGRTATSPPTISTPRRCSRRRSRPVCGWRSRAVSATSTGCCRWSPRRTSGTASPSPLRRLPGARHALPAAGRGGGATFLASDDHLRRAIPSDDPSEVRAQNIDSGWKRVIFRYARLLPDGASVVVTPSFGFDSSSNQELFGSTPSTSGRAPTSTRCAPPTGAGSDCRRRSRSASTCRRSRRRSTATAR